MAKRIMIDNQNLSKAKTKMLGKILTGGFNHITGDKSYFNGPLYVELLGGSFESIKEKLDDIDFPTPIQSTLRALVNTIDTKMDSYAAKKGYQLMYAFESEEDPFAEDSMDEEKIVDKEADFIVEDADTELERGDNPDIDTESFDSTSSATSSISETIQEIVSDLANKHADEIRNVAKTILKLEKANQDNILQEKKEEEGEFIEDLDTAPEEDKKEGEGDDKNNGNSEDTGNDFGGDSDDTDPFSDSSDSSSEDASGDNGKNPFDDESENGENQNKDEEEQDGLGSESSNPFDNEDSAPGSFESSYSYITAKLLGTGRQYRPFEDLPMGSVLKYAQYCATEALKEKMERAYATESAEELTNQLNNYKKITKLMAHATADTLSVAAFVGLPIDLNVIKYPML